MEKMYDWKNTVVKIFYKKDFLGSGFFVLPSGYILTCYHIFDNNNISIENPYEPDIFAKFLDSSNKEVSYRCRFHQARSNKEKDIAVLSVLDADYKFPFVFLYERISAGNKVISYGYQSLLEFEGYPIYGEILDKSKKREDDKLHDCIVIKDTNIACGSSGAPLYDTSTERVIGIIQAFLEERNEAIAIPVSDIYINWNELNETNAQKAATHFPNIKKKKKKKNISDTHKLLGFEVKENVLINDKYFLDFIAEYPVPGGNKKIKIFIECVYSDNDKIEADQVEDIIEKYERARRIVKDISFGRIITNKPYRQNCAKIYNIENYELLTVEEFTNNLINFDRYLIKLIPEFCT